MGNESGEWIMHGMKWDNPDCIHSVDEAIKYINEFGFLPLFKNDIDGFSLEERTVPEYWWSDNPEIDPWMWRAYFFMGLRSLDTIRCASVAA